jgi:hypothetical protein
MYARGWAVARIRESIDGAIVHHFVVASTVQILLQSVASWGNPVAGSKWGSRRAECQLPVRGLIWVRLLHRLTCAALWRWPDWLPSCGLQRGLKWLTSSTLWRRLDGLASNALRGRLDWLASQRRLRTGLSNFHGASLKGCSIEYLLHARAEDSHHHLFERA